MELSSDLVEPIFESDPFTPQQTVASKHGGAWPIVERDRASMEYVSVIPRSHDQHLIQPRRPPSCIANAHADLVDDSKLDGQKGQTLHVQLEKLWDIFTSYCLQMFSEDPCRMRVNAVVKLLQDCQIIDSSNSEQAQLMEKEIMIVCDSYLKAHPSKRDATKKLDFSAFLGLLHHFAEMSGDTDPERAYNSLVSTILDKQYNSRVVTSVDQEMHECKKTLHAFEEPLARIFSFYAAQSQRKMKKLDPKLAQLSPLHMGYMECLAFARKYGIIAPGVLTTIEFASRYVDSLAKKPVHEYERVLTVDGFAELLVRLSLHACPGAETTCANKLKGLFQLMWLASTSRSQRALTIADVVKTDKADVTAQFAGHFEKFWRKEGYPDGVRSVASDSMVWMRRNYANEPGSSKYKIGKTSDYIARTPLSPFTGATRLVSRRISLCVPSSSPSVHGGSGGESIVRSTKLSQRRFSG